MHLSWVGWDGDYVVRGTSTTLSTHGGNLGATLRYLGSSPPLRVGIGPHPFGIPESSEGLAGYLKMRSRPVQFSLRVLPPARSMNLSRASSIWA
jgi:hypothetical protein